MYLAVQPKLVERVVFEAVRGDATLRPHYERQFSDCHERREGDVRDRAFAELHERWFNELGLRGLLIELVNEFPNVRSRVDRLMVAQAPGPKARSAELFGAAGNYTIVMAVAPSALLDRRAFSYWARHELLHVDDLLNPAFGYDADRRPDAATAARRNLVQDRYAVLWALSVDARLNRKGLAPADVYEKRRTELARAFGMHDDKEASEIFNELWTQEPSFSPDHETLLDYSKNGLPSQRMSEQPEDDLLPTAGAPCPLCGFPTFTWAARQDECRELTAAILADFPKWTTREAICERCAEVYRMVVRDAPGVQAARSGA